jgi:hypothetical protein
MGTFMAGVWRRRTVCVAGIAAASLLAVATAGQARPATRADYAIIDQLLAHASQDAPAGEDREHLRDRPYAAYTATEYSAGFRPNTYIVFHDAFVTEYGRHGTALYLLLRTAANRHSEDWEIRATGGGEGFACNEVRSRQVRAELHLAACRTEREQQEERRQAEKLKAAEVSYEEKEREALESAERTCRSMYNGAIGGDEAEREENTRSGPSGPEFLCTPLSRESEQKPIWIE